MIVKLDALNSGDLSMADLIVLAGYVAIEHDGGSTMKFCGNRVDASDAAYSENLGPRDYYDTTEAKVKDDMVVRGLSMEHGVALYGMPTDVFEFGAIFSVLKDGTVGSDNGSITITLDGTTYVLTEEQAVLQSDAELRAIVDKFADDEEAFKMAFAEAWVYMMNAGRYDGPNSNVCDDSPPPDAPTPSPVEDAPTQEPSSGATFVSTAVATTIALLGGAWLA